MAEPFPAGGEEVAGDEVEDEDVVGMDVEEGVSWKRMKPVEVSWKWNSWMR